MYGKGVEEDLLILRKAMFLFADVLGGRGKRASPFERGGGR